MKKLAFLVNSDEVFLRQDLTKLVSLIRENRYEIFADEIYRDILSEKYPEIRFASEEKILDGASFAFSLGGDGTMISSARRVRGRGIPLVGINFGRVGYLTTLEKDELEDLRKLLQGHSTIEQRALLSVEVLRGGKKIPMPNLALNEVLLANAPVTKMLTFDLYVNSVRTQSLKADGIILSTPSGSTGYSLSVGGPIVCPTLRCIVASPLAPHSLSSRPVIFDENSVLELRNIKSRENKVYIAIDGCDVFYLEKGDTVHISLAEETLPLVRKNNESFLNTLQTKINR
ncbi:MAG: NAD(+)/NADH kinase [Clostridia bacterium]|nr:NAD(+)/NADH kinase [Clostridia bacterium]